MMGSEAETHEDDPGQGTAFYSCLETRNGGTEVFYSVCTWKAWWGENPEFINALFPDDPDSEVIISIESSRQLSISIGKPTAEGTLQLNAANGRVVEKKLSVPKSDKTT